MNVKIKDKEFNLSAKIATIKKIEDTIGMPYFQMLDHLETLSISDYVNILKCGVKEEEQEEFVNLVEEEWGTDKLGQAVVELVNELQYTGLTKLERQKREQELAKTLK